MKRPKMPDLRIPKKYRDGKLLADAETKFEAQLQAARDTVDPIERLSAFLKFDQELTAHVTKLYRDLGGRSEGLGVSAMLTSVFGGFFGAVIVGTLVNPFLGGALLIAGGAGFWGSINMDGPSQIILKKMKAHWDKLEEFSNAATAGVDDALQSHAPAILASPATEGLAKEYPELKDKLFFAFNRLAMQNQLGVSPDLGRAMRAILPTSDKPKLPRA